jgi:hypothetical protein
MSSELMLKRFYNHINKRYHGGELPPVKIFFAPVSGDYGETNLIDGVFVVKINPSEEGRPKSWKFAVHHEAVHVKIWPNRSCNGKRFQEEMQRLAMSNAFRGIW